MKTIDRLISRRNSIGWFGKRKIFLEKTRRNKRQKEGNFSSNEKQFSFFGNASLYKLFYSPRVLFPCQALSWQLLLKGSRLVSGGERAGWRMEARPFFSKLMPDAKLPLEITKPTYFSSCVRHYRPFLRAISV